MSLPMSALHLALLSACLHSLPTPASGTPTPAPSASLSSHTLPHSLPTPASGTPSGSLPSHTLLPRKPRSLAPPASQSQQKALLPPVHHRHPHSALSHEAQHLSQSAPLPTTDESSRLPGGAADSSTQQAAGSSREQAASSRQAFGYALGGVETEEGRWSGVRARSEYWSVRSLGEMEKVARGAEAGTGRASSASSRGLASFQRELQTDPCAGVRCPDVSFCSPVKGLGSGVGVGACVCPPAQFSRLLNGKCTAAPLLHWGYLDPHNSARAAVGSLPLVWDDTLAAQAQDWASTLAADPTSPCKLALGPRPPGIGQNVANFFFDATFSFKNFQGMNIWVGQGANYQYSAFDIQGAAGCSTGNWRDCATYTQVIWNATRSIGCGVGKCPSVQGKVWVCNYSPAGNKVGQFPYSK